MQLWSTAFLLQSVALMFVQIVRGADDCGNGALGVLLLAAVWCGLWLKAARDYTVLKSFVRHPESFFWIQLVEPAAWCELAPWRWFVRSRRLAFFSSRVAEVNILAAMRERVAKYAEGETDLSKIRMMIRDDLRRANYTPEPGQENTIHDLFSQARLDVIIKTNVAQARGYMQYAEGMSPGAFAAFPAQEFTRIAHRRNQRQDWPQR